MSIPYGVTLVLELMCALVHEHAILILILKTGPLMVCLETFKL